MEMNSLSLQYINLRTGGITRHPCNTGVYLKSIIKQRNDAIALFPTTTCLSIFDDIEFYSEMKLNLFKSSHPDFERQRENLMKILACLNVSEAYTTRLIYGTDEVAVVDDDGMYANDENGCMVLPDRYKLWDEPSQPHADAIITKRYGVALISYSADCPTAFLRDKRTGAIGVLHSMWRGLVKEHDGKFTSIVETTVEAMQNNYLTNPEDLEVTIFPCIGTDQFEVKSDVTSKFEQRGLQEFIYKEPDTEIARIDLKGAMKELFIRCGVLPENIETTWYTTADYGLNSLRMSPTNYPGVLGMTGKECYDSVVDIGFGEEPTPIAQLEKTKLKTNASNFLIALRR